MKIPAVYKSDNFVGRVDYAARSLVGGNCRDSRTFDTCFEMYDGDIVIVALMRRAERNPRLMQAIRRLGEQSFETWTALAAKFVGVPDCELPERAALERLECKIAHTKAMIGMLEEAEAAGTIDDARRELLKADRVALTALESELVSTRNPVEQLALL